MQPGNDHRQKSSFVVFKNRHPTCPIATSDQGAEYTLIQGPVLPSVTNSLSAYLNPFYRIYILNREVSRKWFETSALARHSAGRRAREGPTRKRGKGTGRHNHDPVVLAGLRGPVRRLAATDPGPKVAMVREHTVLPHRRHARACVRDCTYRTEGAMPARIL